VAPNVFESLPFSTPSHITIYNLGFFFYFNPFLFLYIFFYFSLFHMFETIMPQDISRAGSNCLGHLPSIYHVNPTFSSFCRDPSYLGHLPSIYLISPILISFLGLHSKYSAGNLIKHRYQICISEIWYAKTNLGRLFLWDFCFLFGRKNECILTETIHVLIMTLPGSGLKGHNISIELSGRGEFVCPDPFSYQLCRFILWEVIIAGLELLFIFLFPFVEWCWVSCVKPQC